MQKYSKKRLCPLGTQQSLRGHVAMKKWSSYNADHAFIGKGLNRDTTAEWLTSGTENECTVERENRHWEVDGMLNITMSSSTISSDHGA